MVSRTQTDQQATSVEPSTVESLLEAATQVFMETGFAGARVDQIARQAQVNKAMIYYHFRSKRGLYQAVLGRLF
ncbi:MAG TPA: helix-turn-helix domain-containing protein, partial [Vicinamibacteria bacterium]|nr:helix-turn-helix domain-containing protein [Vicinamibacteria bacterium]